MELTDLIDTKHGLAVLLASICVILTLLLVIQVAKFVWSIIKEKQQASENTVAENTKAVQSLTKSTESLNARLGEVEKHLSEIPKMKKDLRRNFNALKLIAGKDWPKIREALDDDFDI